MKKMGWRRGEPRGIAYGAFRPRHLGAALPLMNPCASWSSLPYVWRVPPAIPRGDVERYSLRGPRFHHAREMRVSVGAVWRWSELYERRKLTSPARGRPRKTWERAVSLV